MRDEVEVGFDGERLSKGFHDPDAGTLDFVVEGDADGGSAAAWGDVLTIGLDADRMVAHLACATAELPAADDLPTRPADAPRAVAAGVTLRVDLDVRGLFDGTEGTLRLAFGDLEPAHWARLGENLVWLAIDEDTQLAALVIEGISRDPGGKAQAAWLAEMNAGA